MTKLKLTFISLLALTGAITAAPYGTNIPAPSNITGTFSFQHQTYAVQYDSVFGGHWNLTGRHKGVRDNGVPANQDTFRGTVSDHSIAGTFVWKPSFGWMSDWMKLHNLDTSCYRFSVTFDGRGNVSGTALYRQ